MKNIVFTLCSNNYLAHAKTLADSLVKHQDDLEFIIGLVDKKDPTIDYQFFAPHEILLFNEIGYPEFDEMLAMYNIIEFNTAVKPFFIEYLFNRFGEGVNVFYIDPDIVFYDSLDELTGLLSSNNLVLTPHLTHPTPEVTFDELVAMRHGHYNLGFLGIKNTQESRRFIQWWKSRLLKHCVIDKPRGLFVDQKWVNLAPLYFDGIYNFKHQGYNMAWWNLGERKLISKGNDYFVNHEGQPLVFFHFSGFKPGSGNFFGRADIPEYSFETRKDLKKIFDEYSELLHNNRYTQLWSIKPALQFGWNKPKPKVTTTAKVKRILKALHLR